MENCIKTQLKDCFVQCQISQTLFRMRISKSRSQGNQNFSICAWCLYSWDLSISIITLPKNKGLFSTKIYTNLVLFFRKFHAIPKVDWNLMDLKLQSLFVNLMIIEVILDQVKNILIQNYYEQLGLENVFFLWWLSFYFENIGKIP